MIRLHTSVFYVLLACLLFVSCKKEEPEEYPKREKIDFTFIAYIIAENSLTGNAVPNINDIESGIEQMKSDINVLVFVDDKKSAPCLIEMQRNADGSVTRKTVREWEETNVVDADFMADVLKYINEQYPSKSYGLDLWSHGMAWIPSNNPLKKSKSTKWFGEDNGEIMDIKELNRALSSSGIHFDFILFDACLMASIEVAYEIRNNADYIIASPIEVWEMGYPYVEMMKAMEYEDRHLRIAKAYSDFYNGEFNSSYGIKMTGAISVIDCNRLEHLATETKLLLVENEENDIKDIRNGIIRYDRWNYHFLYDLGHYMNELVGKENTSDWFDVYNKTMIYSYSTPTFGDSWGGYLDLDPENYTGLGTYIPQQRYSVWNEYYKTLQWFTDTDYLPIY